jgi:hypothetical protein
MTHKVANGATNAPAAVRRPDYSITDAEVAIIKSVMQAAPGGRVADLVEIGFARLRWAQVSRHAARSMP